MLAEFEHRLDEVGVGGHGAGDDGDIVESPGSFEALAFGRHLRIPSSVAISGALSARGGEDGCWGMASGGA